MYKAKRIGLTLFIVAMFFIANCGTGFAVLGYLSRVKDVDGGLLFVLLAAVGVWVMGNGVALWAMDKEAKLNHGCVQKEISP